MVTVHQPDYQPQSNENDAVRNKKEKTVSIPVLYGGMNAVKEIAEKLIPKFHDGLATAHILYVCRNKASKSGGKAVPGKTYKPSPLYKYLTMDSLAAQEDHKLMDRSSWPQADFIVEVALDVWNEMSPVQRTAVVDHLLSRCVGVEDEKTGEIKFAVRSPNVQEFPEVAERNGTWNEDLVEMRTSLMDK